MDLEQYEIYEGVNGTLQFRRGPGMEKAQKELSRLEDIEEIPYYDFMARIRVEKEYHRYMTGFKRIKNEMVSISKKIQRINQKLERASHYPDAASNRHKLLNDKRKCVEDIRKCQEEVWDVGRVKIQNCAKALGKEILPDIEFKFYVDVDAV